MKVNVCGVPYKVIECDDSFDVGTHFGQIDYADAIIKINRKLSKEMWNETLCHEMLHGMLVHLGYSDLTQDEKFVSSLGNAIYNAFDLRIEKSEGEK